MSWIEEVDLGDRDLPEVFRAMSLDPRGLECVKALNEALAFGGSGLSRVQEEAIATVVAVANRCRYAALIHGGFLRRHSGDAGLAAALLDDYTRADLTPGDQRMLDFAVKLTRQPSAVSRADVAGLRQAGFEDRQILAIVLATCLFNFMDRLADGLGVAAPPDYARLVESWLTGPAAEQDWLLREKGE